MSKLLDSVEAIATRNADLLSTRYRDHALTGNLSGFRELHIQGDWLLVYKIKNHTHLAAGSNRYPRLAAVTL